MDLLKSVILGGQKPFLASWPLAEMNRNLVFRYLILPYCCGQVICKLNKEVYFGTLHLYHKRPQDSKPFF